MTTSSQDVHRLTELAVAGITLGPAPYIALISAVEEANALLYLGRMFWKLAYPLGPLVLSSHFVDLHLMDLSSVEKRGVVDRAFCGELIGRCRLP